jgi:hypothetical protein
VDVTGQIGQSKNKPWIDEQADPATKEILHCAR